ncbi:hypothetical protein QBC42DRAFT_4825 [Cladorrhinum samala]|uniref:C2H2-type domain-containing protein n=1 Tax=Cladorrhinum samala TaxID=585594 RepID=A0AAV9HGG9_9PEZI|nr:hypothetical protein QBC42DRAFT_4825 [Cladorrhinum samala]
MPQSSKPAPSASSFVCSDGSCADNPQTFTGGGAYRMHLKRHSRPYKCRRPDCCYNKRGFPQLRDLQRHEVTHKGARSFRCYFEGCRGSATRLDNMVRHVQMAHKVKVRKAEIAALCSGPGS